MLKPPTAEALLELHQRLNLLDIVFVGADHADTATR
jgi:hypothetical protein